MSIKIGMRVEVIDGDYIGVQGVVESVHQGATVKRDFLRVRFDQDPERVLPEAPLYREEQLRALTHGGVWHIRY
jgi:hypothetical protein